MYTKFHIYVFFFVFVFVYKLRIMVSNSIALLIQNSYIHKAKQRDKPHESFRFPLVLRFSSGTLAFSLHSGIPWYSGFLLALWFSPYIHVFHGTLAFSLHSSFHWHSGFLFIFRFSSCTMAFTLHPGFLWYSGFLLTLCLSLYIQVFSGTQVFF